VSYPFADAMFTVTHCGRICFHGRKINLSHAFAGQNVGVTQVEPYWDCRRAHSLRGWTHGKTQQVFS
jgi:hypothetical protein